MDTRREVRFWAKVRKSEGCWEWQGAVSSGGYGAFWDGTATRPAHRAAYELVVGQIPTSLDIDHLCRNRRCVRPDHLEAVTRHENVMRSPIASAAVNARATACVKGHPFDTQNSYTRPNGARTCRQCNAQSVRAYKARKRLSA